MIKTAYTHAGVFHADDVFSTALLKILNPQVEIRRVNQIPDGITDNDETIVYDIGGGKYDHHKEIKLRENGIPYSSFGLLWDEFGHELVDENSAAIIENTLVIPIDLQDNGKERNPLSETINLLNPLWDTNESMGKQFSKAVALAMSILNRSIASTKSAYHAREIVLEKMEQATNGVMVLDQFVPYQRYVPKDGNIKVVVYPSIRGGWNVQTISSEMYPLPEAWAHELPDGMTFAHPGRFIAACTDRKTAEHYAAIAAEPYI